jgi:RND family efflux transporter MFP subunit/putative MATE family efflux protein
VLLDGPILGTLLRLATPNVLVMVVQSSVGLLETYFVARLGTDALAGVALVFPVFMLMQMMSAGAMGGGISSAIARALGAGRRAKADALVLHALAIAGGFGLLFMLIVLGSGRWLYSAMGGTGASLTAALAYSEVVFAGAILVWTFNSLASAIRGTGNMAVPAVVTCAGAVVLIPVSPCLIFGWGPFPELGIAGGAVAVITYYAAGTIVFAAYLWAGRSSVRLSFSNARLCWPLFRDILRVGAVAALITLQTNLTIALAMGLVGRFGPAAIAGYGTGSRLEYLLVPLVFGLGAPLVAMVGTNIGAGQRDRALRSAWIGAGLAMGLTETIGVWAAMFPHAWLSLFGTDPAMLDAGARYLRAVGPFYGLYGLGLALYFASVGAGRLRWPLLANLTRLMIATAGGWLALHWGGEVSHVFLALGLALAVFGLINAAAVAAGAWFGPVSGLRLTAARVHGTWFDQPAATRRDEEVSYESSPSGGGPACADRNSLEGQVIAEHTSRTDPRRQKERCGRTTQLRKKDRVNMKAYDHSLIVLLLIVSSCLALGGCKREPLALAATPPPVVVVSHPVEREVSDYYEYTGRTAAKDAVEVRARVSGYLVNVYFREGAVVKKGDLLFQIDPRPFQAVLDEAKGQVAQWEAKLARAEADVTRYERLLPKGAASQKDLDQAVADRGEARAAIQSARGVVDRAALDLGFTRVTAPISGRIGRYLITEGNLVTMNSTLLTTIVSIDPMYAYFDADEGSVLYVRQLIREGKVRSPRDSGSEVPVLLGLANETGFPHQGTVNFVDNQVNPQTGTVRVRGVFPNEPEVLLPGFFARVRLLIGQTHGALLVTERAIDTDQGQKILYVVNDKDEVVSRPIRVGALHDGLRVIEEGVQPGERVIVNGLLQVRPGITVEPKLVDMPVSLASK